MEAASSALGKGKKGWKHAGERERKGREGNRSK